MKSRRGQGPMSRFSGQTPLDRAISHRNVEMAQFLLSLEQPVHCCYHKEGSPGHTWLLSVQEKMHEQRNTVIPASSWSIEEVCAWVKKIGYPQYADTFEKEMIDGSVLFMIEPNDFSESLGIDPETGKIFMAEIQKLREEPFAQRQKARQQELDNMRGKKKKAEPTKVEELRSIEELVQLINGNGATGASTKTITNKKKKNKKNKSQPADEEGSAENSPSTSYDPKQNFLSSIEERQQPKLNHNAIEEKPPEKLERIQKKEIITESDSNRWTKNEKPRKLKNQTTQEVDEQEVTGRIDDQTYIQDLEFMRSHCDGVLGNDTNNFEEEPFDPEVDQEVEEWRLRLQNASLGLDDYIYEWKPHHRPLIVGQSDLL